jgi:hypothetical protein
MTCKHCASPFVSPTGWPRSYCSPRCKNAAGGRLRRERNASRTHRQCYRCKVTKPAGDFGGPSRTYCRLCHNDYHRTKAATVPVDIRAARRRRSYAQEDPARRAANRLLWKWGLTEATLAERLAEQGGGCAICSAGEPGGRGRWHVDHDHACCPAGRSCGRCIRGLLCTRCNVGLGNFRDNPELLRTAAAYLAKHRPAASAAA